METRDILSLISKIRERANKFIMHAMEEWGIKDLASSHGDIINALLKRDRLTMKELAEVIGKDKSTVTALVDKLISLGYVEKARDVEDNRVAFVTLSDKGRELKPMFEAISKDVISAVYKDISQEERDELVRILTKIKNNL